MSAPPPGGAASLRTARDGAKEPRKASRPSGRFTPARRDRIVQEAAVLFLERGYEEVSIDDIVERVGGSKGTIYAWFGGKALLFEAVIREFCARTSRDLEVEFDETQPIEEQLRRFSKAFLKLILSSQSLRLHRLVVSITIRFPQLAKAFYDAGPESAYGLLQRWIERQQASGRLKPGEARQMAILFLDMLTGHHQLAGLLGIAGETSPAKVDQTTRAATRLFVESYGVAPVRAGA